MNRLVDALMANPQVVELAVQKGRASFGSLVDQLGDTLLSRPERDFLFGDPNLLSRLQAGYLRTITAPDWDGALRLTVGQEIATEWWTVMIPAASGLVGLTLPEDSSRTALLALFTDPAAGATTVAYDPGRGSVLELPASAHCPPSSSGHCADGWCGGCEAVEVLHRKTGRGIKCRCRCLRQDRQPQS